MVVMLDALASAIEMGAGAAGNLGLGPSERQNFICAYVNQFPRQGVVFYTWYG